MKLDKRRLSVLPKVLLHEHLDGVLRPQTVIDLAKETKYDGPSHQRSISAGRVVSSRR